VIAEPTPAVCLGFNRSLLWILELAAIVGEGWRADCVCRGGARQANNKSNTYDDRQHDGRGRGDSAFHSCETTIS
jgi:hypothetical protein